MCLYPRLIKNKKYTPTKKNGGVVPVITDTRLLAVPIKCGNCMECRKQTAREWTARLQNEVKYNKNGKFITLTFSNESIAELTKEITKYEKREVISSKTYVDKNGKLRERKKYKIITETTIIDGYNTDNAIAKLAVRRWLERWRKMFGKSVRHWLITELGHQGTENIHLHGIIWTDEISAIEKTWKYGFIWTGKKLTNGKIQQYVSDRTVNYIVKYVTKPDIDHQLYKPRILCSAGIGNKFAETDGKINRYVEGKTIEAMTTKTGHKISLPIYWRNKIYTEQEREKLWIEKLNKQKRYVNGIEIDISKGEEEYYKVLETARLKSIRLGYGNGIKNWKREKYEHERRVLLQKERINRANIKPERSDNWGKINGIPISKDITWYT